MPDDPTPPKEPLPAPNDDAAIRKRNKHLAQHMTLTGDDVVSIRLVVNTDGTTNWEITCRGKGPSPLP